MPLSVAAFGDSITTPTFDGASYIQLLDPALYTVADHGVSSNLTSEVLGRFASWVTAGNRADVAIFLSGTPDFLMTPNRPYGDKWKAPYRESASAQNVRDMVELALSVGIDAVVIAPLPILWPCDGIESSTGVRPSCAQMNARAESFRFALLPIPIELGVPFIDGYELFGGLPGDPGAAAPLLSADGLHPSPLGDARIAAAVRAVLQERFPTGAPVPEPGASVLFALGALLLLRRSGARAALLSGVLLAPALLGPPPAHAVIVASGDGGGNTTPPTSQGFGHVGVRGNATGVYLGEGWAITAVHVPVGALELYAVAYPAVAGSAVVLETAPGVPADLQLFRLVADPHLDALPIAAASPDVGTDVTLFGAGRNRGAATSWNGRGGFLWGSARTLRWGTNEVEARALWIPLDSGTLTRAFSTEFSAGLPTAHEAAASEGDSGGAAFVFQNGRFELAGILFARGDLSAQGQPPATAIYGNTALIADLAPYRSQILAALALRACSNGVDDDGDGLTDLSDSGCSSPSDPFETEACSDLIDNDGDGAADFPADLQCWSVNDSSEDGPSRRGTCGLGFEAGLAVAAWALLRRRRRARQA